MSKRFTLNIDDVSSILRGAILAGVGASVTYLLEWFGAVDWGENQALAAAVLAILANVLRKWVSGGK